MPLACKLSVIVAPTLKGDWFETCLCSVGAAVVDMNVEVIVAEEPSAASGLGIVAAYNKAYLQSHGEYILFLQPDVILGENLLRTLCCLMDDRPDAGGIGLRITRPYARPGRRSAIPESLPPPFLFIRRDCFYSLGKFDETLPLEAAAANISHRLNLRAYPLLYYPLDTIFHFGLPKFDLTPSQPLRKRLSLRSVLACMPKPFKRKRERALRGGKTLILCKEERFYELYMLCQREFPPQQAIVPWYTGRERISELLSRNSRMKGYSAYIFCHPDVRFEQMIFLTERLNSKLASYHIYNAGTGSLISPPSYP
jgi:hypothetical protein